MRNRTLIFFKITMKKKYTPFPYLRLMLGVIAVLLFIQCSKTENLQNEATIKIDNTYNSFDSILTTAPNGWKMLVYPDIQKNKSNKGGFAFFMKFAKNGQVVTMLSDFNNEMGTVSKESKYALKFTSLTTLSFATYNYINFIADPNSALNGGQEIGASNRVDIEYSYLNKSTNNDTLFLKGNLQNCRAMLIRAKPEEEKYFFTDHQYSDLKSRFAAAIRGKVGLHVKKGNDLSVMTLAMEQRQITFAKDISEDSVYIHRSGIAYNGVNSMLLDIPYSYNGLTVKELILENGQVKAKDIAGNNVEIVEQEFPVISAFKMMRTGAYSAIVVPYDNTFYISGFVSDRLEWPNNSATNTFLSSTLSSSFGVLFGVILSQFRFYDISMQFKSAQQRFILNFNMGIYDGTRPDAPDPSSSADDSFYGKYSLPYQYRYTYTQDDVFNLYYEGPQFVFASQLPELKNSFRDATRLAQPSLKYTKSPTELLIAFYDKQTNKILFEGRPY